MRGQYRHVVAYLKDFLFKPEQAQCPVAALSGGEKNRLMLAVALAKQSNFLVLDEPTNDLDMDTLDLLQEVLMEYDGTILLVSHDRDFIDRVVTSVIYMPGDGSVTEHAGSYSELLEKLRGKPATKEDKKPAAAKSIAKATVSQHLKELKESGLIQGEIETPKVKYCINRENWKIASMLFSKFFGQCVCKKESCCE